MNSGEWEFDREYIESLDPETRRRLYSQIVKFKLDRLEENISKVSKEIEQLDERISSLRQKILMREIESFLRGDSEEK